MESTESDSKDFMLIEYPGVVKNPQKVIDKLGGMEKIRRVKLNFC